MGPHALMNRERTVCLAWPYRKASGALGVGEEAQRAIRWRDQELSLRMKRHLPGWQEAKGPGLRKVRVERALGLVLGEPCCYTDQTGPWGYSGRLLGSTEKTSRLDFFLL